MPEPLRIRVSKKTNGWTVQVRPFQFGVHDRWFYTGDEAYAAAERLAARLGIEWGKRA